MSNVFDEQFCTDDFDQEMIEFVKELGDFKYRGTFGDDGDKFLKYGTGNNYFWIDNYECSHTLLTKQEFKEKIGMTTGYKLQSCL